MIAILTAGLVLASIASPAAADRGTRADRDDTRGPLDIARIVHNHREGRPNIFIHKIVMHEPWRLRALRSTTRETRRITVTFDVRPNVGYPCAGCITEREVVVYAKDGQLHADLFNHLGDPPRHLADLRVWRPNGRSVAFSVTRRQLGASRVDSYAWGVKTTYSRRGSPSCPPRTACFDVAPDDTLLRHRL